MPSGNSHQVVPREMVPVRRSVYGSGTVTYDWEHEGHKVFVSYTADGRVKFGVEDQILKISGWPYTQRGVNKGVEYTNVGLEPLES
jgi:hypothetical protein